MEARLVSLPTRPTPSITIEPDRIVVDRLVVADPALAGWLAGQPADDHSTLVERAIRIGLTAIQSVGVTLNVDAVRSEFERLADSQRVMTERAAEALEQTLRSNFGDGDGRLPRTLETFLGDRGKLQATVRDLFDPGRKESALGRLGTMLETYFDGDASRLAVLLDPTRIGSPLHQFRTEVAAGFKALEERFVALEAATGARAGERARSSAKGTDFEGLLEGMLAEIARGANDFLERTGTDAGDSGRSKKGDFVLTLDPNAAQGAEIRVVIEAKDRRISGREMRDELREARTNRDAAVGLVVFTPAHAPAGIAPFDVRGGDVYCVVDPLDPDAPTLEAAVRLARLLAVAGWRDREAAVNASAIRDVLLGIREHLEVIRAMKVQLTSIGSTAGQVTTTLDRLRTGILDQIGRAERELAAVTT
jgi:hypothetical protein